MKELINKIKNVMQERDYWLHSTSGNNKVFHFCTPIKEKPNLCCDVFISENDYVEFKFRYLTKRCVILTTDNIGSFFDEEHFHKFETDFWSLACVLYEYEKRN